MNPLGVVRSLGGVDLRNVARDPMLRWFFLLPVGFALLIRFLLPALLLKISIWIDHDLTPHGPALFGYLLVMLTPNVVGVVVAFLLLDQRDDGTLAALRVTPLSLDGYLVYRLGAPMAIGVLLTPLLFPIAGVPVERPLVPWLAALAAAPTAPMMALLVAAFARNKVQGFALMKALGVILWPPLFAFFVPLPEQYLAGLLPLYWPARLYWSAIGGDPHYALWLPVSWAHHALILFWLLRRYRRTVQV